MRLVGPRRGGGWTKVCCTLEYNRRLGEGRGVMQSFPVEREDTVCGGHERGTRQGETGVQQAYPRRHLLSEDQVYWVVSGRGLSVVRLVLRECAGLME